MFLLPQAYQGIISTSSNYISLETSCFILETARMNIIMYSELWDIFIYCEANNMLFNIRLLYYDYII